MFRFPVAFRPPAFASWASCSRQGVGPPLRLAYRPAPGKPESVPDPDGFSMFRTRETRLGLGALYTPGTAVSTRPRMLHDRRLPHHSGNVPICPALPTRPGQLC
jgi:hypothetical protein